MTVARGQRVDDPESWDRLVQSLGGHPLQLWGWGALKARRNWRVVRVAVVDGDDVIGGAQVLIRALPWPFNEFLYVPRGPFAREGREAEALGSIESFVRAELRAVALSIEPDSATVHLTGRWRRSDNAILMPQTLILDLRRSSEELLGHMPKKTRQYIRKSGREPLDIRQVRARDELGRCLEIYHQTAARAGFALHDDAYYYDLFEDMSDSAAVFASYQGDEPVAFLWVAYSRSTAFELYGGVNEDGQRLRANYALKWHAITVCQEQGVERYDLNGLLNDGVSTFKRGFADHEDTLAGTYDLPLSPLYLAWDKGLPLAKRLARVPRSLRRQFDGLRRRARWK